MIRKRLFCYVLAITFLFFAVIVRVFTVEVISSSSLQKKAVDQWTRELPVKAKRGDILSSDGKVLAGSQPCFAVYIRTRSVTDPEKVSDVLSRLFSVDKDKLYQKIIKKATSEITVKRRVNKLDIVKLCEYDLDGVYYSADQNRVYPYGEALCSVLGYLSSDFIGQAGLEKYYDEYLKGVDGEILYESDLTGEDLEGSTPYYTEGVDGLNVNLNIDLEIQLICENALKKVIDEYTPKRCSAIVLSPSDGRILALSSLPSYDLNQVPRDDITKLNELSRTTALVDCYEPGSTFKIITAIADIEETLLGNPKAKSLNYVFSSSRYRTVKGGKIKCWSNHENGKHSNQTLKEALNNSCNPCFTDIALSLGKSTYYKYVNLFNFGKKTGVDFYGEASGMVIPESAVKEGDLARIAFGQSVAVTEIQLAAAAASVVNGGNYYAPRFIDKITDKEGNVVEIFPPKFVKKTCSEKASRILASYLEGVVKDGSGKQCYIEGYKIGGKTGTAQKFENGAIKSGKYVMSFLGFFPSDNPKYLCLVTVDEPIGGAYGSTVAAPVARDIFQGIINAKSIQKFE